MDNRTKAIKKALAEENAAKLKAGDKVSHSAFGEGTIILVDTANARVHILFENFGNKKLTLADIFKYVEVVKEEGESNG